MWLHRMVPLVVLIWSCYVLAEGTWTPYKGVRIAPATCAVAPECQARKAIDQGLVLPQKFRLGEGGRNPATIICGLLHGRELNMRSAKGSVEGICHFQDKSKVPSWDLLKIIK